MTKSKVAFCFPGQGSLELGMGRDIAEVVPEAMRVFELGSAASGLDLERLCFDADLEELVETDAAAGARGDEPRRPGCPAGPGPRAGLRVGHSVEFAALAAASSIGRRDDRPQL
jgi:[acyl-carrier-protein] S-malonyltransferase